MTPHRLLDLYRLMSRIRQFENAAEIASQGGVAAWLPQPSPRWGAARCTCQPGKKPWPQACATTLSEPTC